MLASTHAPGSTLTVGISLDSVDANAGVVTCGCRELADLEAKSELALAEARRHAHVALDARLAQKHAAELWSALAPGAAGGGLVCSVHGPWTVRVTDWRLFTQLSDLAGAEGRGVRAGDDAPSGGHGSHGSR